MIYFLNEDEQVVAAKEKKGLTTLGRKFAEDSLDELDLSLPISKLHPNMKKGEENYVYLEGVNDGIFQIVNKSTNHESMSYKAINVITHEISGLGLTKLREFENVQLKEIVKYVLQGSKYKLDETVNTRYLNTTVPYFYVETGDKGTQLERLEDELFDIGFVFDYKVSIEENVRRTRDMQKHYLKREVLLVPREPRVVKVRDYQTGDNIISYELTEDLSAKYDAIAPTGEEDKDTGEVVTITDVVWRKADGDKLDKPKGQDYISYRKNPKRIKTVSHSGENDPENLIILAYNELVEEYKTKENIKLTVYDKKEIEVGKYVEVEFHREDLGSYIKEVKVLSVNKDYKHPEIVDLELGEGLHKTLGKRLKELEDKIEEDEKKDERETFVVGEKMSQTLVAQDCVYAFGMYPRVWYNWDVRRGFNRNDRIMYLYDGKGVESQTEASYDEYVKGDKTIKGSYDHRAIPGSVHLRPNREDMGGMDKVFKLKMDYKINKGYELTRLVVINIRLNGTMTFGELIRPNINLGKAYTEVVVDENVKGKSGKLEFILNESENYWRMGETNYLIIIPYINKKEGVYNELPLPYVDAMEDYIDYDKNKLTGYLENVRIDKYRIEEFNPKER